MIEQYPIHIMIKPEGLQFFPQYITTQIELLEVLNNNGQYRKLRTVLTPDEVEMIYPKNSAPVALKEYLTKRPTEHHFLQGGQQIYENAKVMKGKYGQSSGIRGVLSSNVDKLGINIEKWQNFIHSADNERESAAICLNFNTDKKNCANCVSRSLCYKS